MIDSVCIFGDSVAKGVVLKSTEEKYVLLKDSFVNRIQESSGITVKNYSRFGSTVTRGMKALLKHRGELSQYDHVLLEFGGNDCDYNWPQVAADPEKDFQPNTPMGIFVQKYTQMVQEIRAAGSCPVILSLPPVEPNRYFSWISRGLNADNILNWLGDAGRIYRWHEMYNFAVCRLANDTHTPFVDITTPFLEMWHYEKLICKDGIHPNEAGHKLIAEALDSAISHYRKAYAS